MLPSLLSLLLGLLVPTVCDNDQYPFCSLFLPAVAFLSRPPTSLVRLARALFPIWWSKALPNPRTQNKPIKIFESVILSFKAEETYWSQTCFVCECRQKLYVTPDIFCPSICRRNGRIQILYFAIKQHFLGPHSWTQNLPRYYHS